MATAALHRIDLPRHQRRYGFALTPLADAMFQVLIFFMLSSNLSPYSLLDLRGGALAVGGGGGDAPDPGQQAAPAMPAGETAIWSVSGDGIVASGQRFGFDRLPDLAAALDQAGTARVLLVSQPGAQVQNLVAVIESLSLAGISDVQLARGPGG
ncbi:MAG: biopolymer transporter ExbD [Paracoccus sp. (in: a-proteobacteria)]|uniref:ExbD/TolR family protein n=1 Tax=Paracoccus sp. TaxID=267 RepID=UPI0026DED3B6|nr:biopolymer transporter ExbD [Paracoccus sp. (in: a-proteobacteria)]MDO5612950.1 biopolymer transporter ExbD [Paracoccus sp. (in: a-proteobacteria)]